MPFPVVRLATLLPRKYAVPALLTTLPEMGYNGPVMQLAMLGDIDAVRHRPTDGRYDVHVANAAGIVADAVRRIRAAGQKYHLAQPAIANLIEHFVRNSGFEP